MDQRIDKGKAYNMNNNINQNYSKLLKQTYNIIKLVLCDIKEPEGKYNIQNEVEILRFLFIKKFNCK